MRYTTTAFLLFSTISQASCIPVSSTDIQQFPAGTPFDIVLSTSSTSMSALRAAEPKTIDIDLFDNASQIKELAKTKTVICYFSAGTREDWRDDADQFRSADYGKAMEDWEGENWLDVTSQNVKDIMKGRIEYAAEMGCHAVDPDNVDGYDVRFYPSLLPTYTHTTTNTSLQSHQDGFSHPKSAYAAYVNYLASVAHANKLAIGLKNSLDIIPDVLSNIEFAVNEQCHEYGECARYAPLTKANKAVFNIEYGLRDCSQPRGVKLSTVLKSADQGLDKLGGQC
ncbi:hypothetical protein BDW02DRAFT_569545 [Decorospora gaudefroyi]|uniref:alpha-galactosidase n=1 Tax=Decorospora gaudefroyi TaxID=184978 RepID=A0A6A5KHF1_9PLEO|nr:hypothetical protein BDW02DRAFT_569545 [Decorospora gaudefroyi]